MSGICVLAWRKEKCLIGTIGEIVYKMHLEEMRREGTDWIHLAHYWVLSLSLTHTHTNACVCVCVYIYIYPHSEHGTKYIYWIDLDQDRDRWYALVNAVMNLLIP
jgi:hypothetical protein